jgi:hypothetical protein
MSFNISQFKAELDSRGGPSRGSLFEVTVTPVHRNTVAGMDARSLRFFCQSATVPNINLQTQEYAPVASNPIFYPTAISASQFNAIFMMDSEHKVLQFFHQWMQAVMNYGTKGGKFSSVGNKLPFEMGYMKDYGARISIKHYTTDSDNNRYYETILDGAYPTGMGETNLSWSDNDNFLTLPIKFAFERIEFSGELEGNPLGLYGRGNGLLSTLGALAGFAGTVQQTVKQGTKFNSVQDAINRIYRVDNSLNKLVNTLG